MEKRTVDKTVDLRLQAQEDVVSVRQSVRSYAVALGLSLVDQTKLVTAASELARNTVMHGGGGTMKLEVIEQNSRRGIRLTFEDRGPGIADIERALQDGYTTGAGLGLGLGGAKRLANEFAIESTLGAGTKVVITQWIKLR
jgi:serine/threonine-protein kinase RsbT